MTARPESSSSRAGRWHFISLRAQKLTKVSPEHIKFPWSICTLRFLWLEFTLSLGDDFRIPFLTHPSFCHNGGKVASKWFISVLIHGSSVAAVFGPASVLWCFSSTRKYAVISCILNFSTGLQIVKRQCRLPVTFLQVLLFLVQQVLCKMGFF